MIESESKTFNIDILSNKEYIDLLFNFSLIDIKTNERMEYIYENCENIMKDKNKDIFNSIFYFNKINKENVELLAKKFDEIGLSISIDRFVGSISPYVLFKKNLFNFVINGEEEYKEDIEKNLYNLDFTIDKIIENSFPIVKKNKMNVETNLSDTFFSLIVSIKEAIVNFMKNDNECDINNENISNLNVLIKNNIDKMKDSISDITDYKLAKLKVLYIFYTIFILSLYEILTQMKDIISLVMKNTDKSFEEIIDKIDIPFFITYEYITSSESNRYSLEAVSPLGVGDSYKRINYRNNVRLEDIENKYNSKLDQLKKIYIEKFKSGKSKLRSKYDSFFFKKHFGRIPHLYARYGNTTIAEHKMNGDPTLILQTGIGKYIGKMSNDAVQLFDEIISISNRVSSATSLTEKLRIIKAFCKKVKFDDSDPYSVRETIKKEVCWRIGNSILQKNVIYGYTIDGIVENGKFPPANHIVVSLFDDNPHEKASEIPVNQIFSSPQSILVFAHPEKGLIHIEELFRQASSNIIATYNGKNAAFAEKRVKEGRKYFDNKINRLDKEMEDETQRGDPKEDRKINRLIEQGLLDALDLVMDQKRRCLQCLAVSHDMIKRVTNLAKRCVVAMLQTEAENTDSAHKTNLKQQSNALINKQNENNLKNINRQNENNIDPRDAFDFKTSKYMI